MRGLDKGWWRAALAALTGSIAVVAQVDREEFVLRPRLRPGQRLHVIEETRQQIEITTPDEPTTRSLEVARTLLLEVLTVTEEGAELALVVARVHGKVSMPVGPPRSFDTLDGALLRTPKQLAGVGAAVRSRIDEAGKILTVRTDVRGRITQDLEPAPQASGQEPLTAQQQARLKRVVTSVFGRTSDAPVALGSTWEHVTRSPDPQLPTVQRSQVTLTAATGELLRLQVSGTVRTDAALATPKTIQVDGAVDGTQLLGRDGVLRASSLRAEARLRLPGMEQPPATMKLESSLRRATEAELAALRSRVKTNLARAEQEAKLNKSNADVRIIASAVRSYLVKNGDLPPDLDALVGAELTELPPDAWGNAYTLVIGPEPGQFCVRSGGPDGEAGTGDDITSRKPK